MSRSARPTSYRPHATAEPIALAWVGADRFVAAALPLARHPHLSGVFALGVYLTTAAIEGA